MDKLRGSGLGHAKDAQGTRSHAYNTRTDGINVEAQVY